MLSTWAGSFGLVVALVLLATASGADHGVPAVGRDSSVAATAGEGSITVAFGGDLSLGRDVNLTAAREGMDHPLSPVHELRDSDLSIVNLESVAAAAGSRNQAIDRLAPNYFRARPETLGVLREAGIDVATTANTHSGDYGTAALLEQLSHLAAMGIASPGSGIDRSAACQPVYLDVRGIVVAILTFDTTRPAFAAGDGAPGTCHYALDDIEQIRVATAPLIEEARERSHVVFVAPHWGVDFESEPSDRKRDVGRMLIELGADAVLGSHAHITQGVELHEGRPILHDAGNVLLSFEEPQPGAVFTLTVTSAGVHSIELVPLVAERGWTRRATAAEAADMHASFERRSEQVGTEVRGGRIELIVNERPPPAQITPTPPIDAGPVPSPLQAAPSECVAEAVPDNAEIAPMKVGPLTLLGVRAENRERLLPGFIRVETYWRAEQPPDRDLLLRGRGEAGHPFGWVWSEEHEPCDWAWPTSRWDTDTIYRDQMLLRPPSEFLSPVGALISMTGAGSPFSVTLGYSDTQHASDWTPVLLEIPYGVPRWVLALAIIGGILLLAGSFLWIRRRRRLRHRSAPAPVEASPRGGERKY